MKRFKKLKCVFTYLKAKSEVNQELCFKISWKFCILLNMIALFALT